MGIFYQAYARIVDRAVPGGRVRVEVAEQQAVLA